MHVFIVDQNFKTFFHLHPEDFNKGFKSKKNGMHAMNLTFPAEGIYYVFLDYSFEGRRIFKINDIKVGKPNQIQEIEKDTQE